MRTPVEVANSCASSSVRAAKESCILIATPKVNAPLNVVPSRSTISNPMMPRMLMTVLTMRAKDRAIVEGSSKRSVGQEQFHPPSSSSVRVWRVTRKMFHHRDAIEIPQKSLLTHHGRLADRIKSAIGPIIATIAGFCIVRARAKASLFVGSGSVEGGEKEKRGNDREDQERVVTVPAGR